MIASDEAPGPCVSGLLEDFDIAPTCRSRMSRLRSADPTLVQNFLSEVGQCSYGTLLADPPWQFANRTGKMAPEHRRLKRYKTLTLQAIKDIPVSVVVAPHSHLYLWVPHALLHEGLEVMEAWGFQYKTNLIWHKIRRDGGPDGRGAGFYFRHTTEMVLFGVRGRLRTLVPGRRRVNLIKTRKREHSRKPDELYEVIKTCSPGPFLELFARNRRAQWDQWGNEVSDDAPAEPTSAGASSMKALAP